MKNFIAAASFAIALGTCAFAQSSQAPVPSSEQTIQLVPFGTWAMCSVNPTMVDSPFCKGMPVYIKGQEPDLLLVTAQRSDTAAFVLHDHGHRHQRPGKNLYRHISSQRFTAKRNCQLYGDQRGYPARRVHHDPGALFDRRTPADPILSSDVQCAARGQAVSQSTVHEIAE